MYTLYDMQKKKESIVAEDTRAASYPRFISDAHSFISERQHFSFYAGEGHQHLHDLKKEKRRDLYRSLFELLIVESTKVLAYPFLPNSKDLLQSPLFEKKGNQWILSGSSDELVDFLLFQIYSGAHNFPITLLFDCAAEEIKWSEFFRHCFDPMILENPSVACSDSALKCMKRTANEGKISIILFRSPVEYPCFLLGSGASQTKSLFDLCSQTAFLTERFTCRYT